MAQFEVTEARRDHCNLVALLHIRRLKQGFLPLLGEGFLTLLYEAMVRDSRTILLVALEEGRLVGFVSGGRELRSLILSMLKEPLRLVRALFFRVFDINIWRGVFSILKNIFGSSEKVKVIELFSIAVSEEALTKRIGSSLYSAFCIEIQNNGGTEFQIMVGSDLKDSLRFYERQGATIVGYKSMHGTSQSYILKHQLVRS